VRPVRVVRPQAGFTILEAVIAAALLLATCVATSGVVSSATKADGAADLRDRLEAALTRECERLAALPFSSADDGVAGSGEGASAGSLVSEVFPFARPELDTERAYIVDSPGDDDAGTFVSISDAGDVRVRREAVFVRGDGDRPGHVGPADLVGWDCASAARPPATTLAVTVEVSARGRSAIRTLVLSALRPTVAPSGQAGS
jgi:hypothetical protein